MLFNSFHFLIFFPVVVALFFGLKKVQHRNLFLLAASWYFYAVWRPEFLLLLIYSTYIDYIVAKKLETRKKLSSRKLLLIISLLGNFGLLLGFKYFTFFDHNLHRFLAHFNIFYHSQIDDILLPVGISFYTFQTVSYTIDVFKKRQKAEQRFYKFALFVSFFPQLVAGPIERASHLMPQFNKIAFWDYRRITDGLKLMFWGFFQKMVIADGMADLVNHVFERPTQFHNIEIILVTLFFAIQIYGDFSGYTDIARGTAKIMGYDIRRNFRSPYFAPSFHVFWERWHITLSSWFRDFVYIPLGGSRVNYWRHAVNIMLTFLLSGFWHGAGWTFLIWGALHGIYYLTEYHMARFLKLNTNKLIIRILKTLMVFAFVNLAWIFFRAKSVTIALILIKNTFNFENIHLNFDHWLIARNLFFTVFLFFIHIVERKTDIVSFLTAQKPMIRWSIYYIMSIIFLFFANFELKEFIYFQF